MGTEDGGWDLVCLVVDTIKEYVRVAKTALTELSFRYTFLVTLKPEIGVMSTSFAKIILKKVGIAPQLGRGELFSIAIVSSPPRPARCRRPAAPDPSSTD
jgi:hypothetical protein